MLIHYLDSDWNEKWETVCDQCTKVIKKYKNKPRYCNSVYLCCRHCKILYKLKEVKM
jgi:hypothetical protein